MNICNQKHSRDENAIYFIGDKSCISNYIIQDTITLRRLRFDKDSANICATFSEQVCKIKDIEIKYFKCEEFVRATTINGEVFG